MTIKEERKLLDKIIKVQEALNGQQREFRPSQVSYQRLAQRIEKLAQARYCLINDSKRAEKLDAARKVIEEYEQKGDLIAF